MGWYGIWVCTSAQRVRLLRGIPEAEAAKLVPWSIVPSVRIYGWAYTAQEFESVCAQARDEITSNHISSARGSYNQLQANLFYVDTSQLSLKK